MNKTVTVEPLARVEGHGGIEVVIKDNQVKEVNIQIFEGPRLMEQLTLGKTPDEAVSITSRICAICYVSHRLSDIIAHEAAIELNPHEKTKLLRKLSHYGEMIESNALHYYFLALPDYLGYPDAITMIKEYPDVVKGALKLKKYGNQIMELIAGRRVHGENMQIGGFGKLPTDDELRDVKNQALALIPIIKEGIEIWESIDIPSFFEEETVFMSVKPAGNEYSFSSDRFMISDGREYTADEYNTVIKERVVPHSFAKRCLYKGKPYTVGALARMLNSSDFLEGMAKDYFKRFYNSRWRKNPHYNNIAQVIEIIFCLEKIPSIIDTILTLPYQTITSQINSGIGTGLVEAPRGLLIHHYQIKKGTVDFADYVIPTNQNLDDMEKYLRIATKDMIKNKVNDMELPLEMIVRAYDPCISCSVHMVKVKKV